MNGYELMAQFENTIREMVMVPKERLKRHPGEWTVEKPQQSVLCWPGQDAILMKNTTDGWIGWFPVKDISIEE